MSQKTSPIDLSFNLYSQAEGPKILEQVKAFYEALRVPRQIRLFTTAEGAGAHCQLDNLPLAFAVVFDWLDQVFRQSSLDHQ